MKKAMSQEKCNRIARKLLLEIEKKSRGGDVEYIMNAYLNIIGQMMAEFVHLSRTMDEDFAEKSIFAGFKRHLEHSMEVPLSHIKDNHNMRWMH